MGSSGSGSFSDYSGNPKNSNAGGGSSGGSSGADQCRQAFTASLEDVAEYDFYLKSRTVPVPGSPLSLRLQGRVVAVDAHGTAVGALPTRLNYLASCLNDGFVYTGAVRISGTGPIPHVSVDFVAA